MTAETRLAELLETPWVPTNKAVLFADITALIGLESTALVVGTIKAASAQNPLMDTILIAMSTVGLSLSTAERQGVIDMLASAGSWPDSVRDNVKALGGTYKPQWQTQGYESEPTIESVQAEIDAAAKSVIVETAKTKVSAKATNVNAWLETYDTADKTIEDVQAYVDSLLASEDGNP
jgi:hypothetical protein